MQLDSSHVSTAALSLQTRGRTDARNRRIRKSCSGELRAIGLAMLRRSSQSVLVCLREVSQLIYILVIGCFSSKMSI